MDQPQDYLVDKSKKIVDSFRNLLQKNDDIATATREFLNQQQIRGFNIMGSPGSGKTTMLEHLIATYQDSKQELAVLEGDLETSRDADRIRGKGVQAYQISTVSGCHLTATMVAEALQELTLDGVNYLFVENVGNLVCPSKFDLGTHANIVTISVPEGDDKPIKYPVIIRMADIVVLTKTDLLPHFNFNLQRCREEISSINPTARILEVNTADSGSFDALWHELGGAS